jgi:hypothetical protein
VLASTTCGIEADAREAPVLLSNGNLVERATCRHDGRHFAVWDDPFPKPSYLFAWSAAISVRFTTLRHGLGPQGGAEHLVENGKETSAPTPWTRSSARCAGTRPPSAANTISTSSTSSPCPISTWARWRTRGSTSSTTATSSPARDRDRCRLRGIEAIIAHEYFHNWTGNRITCRDWFQLCLKEGLTVFRDQEFSIRHALARGEAHRATCAPARRRSSPRTPGRWPIRCARQLSRDQQLLHGDRLREGRRSRSACWRQDAARARAASARAWISTSSATTATPRRSRISSPASPIGASGRDLIAVHALVQPGWHAAAIRRRRHGADR